MTPDGWNKIDRGLFESTDGQWRIVNPWKLDTALRHRWLVAERRASGTGWSIHEGDHTEVQGRDQRGLSARRWVGVWSGCA
jgi:hypothetical protein